MKVTVSVRGVPGTIYEGFSYELCEECSKRLPPFQPCGACVAKMLKVVAEAEQAAKK